MSLGTAAEGHLPSGRLELNVGGDTFVTTLETIQRSPRLTAMLRRDEKGFYVDADPDDFCQLLYYLRDPTARLPEDVDQLYDLKRLAARYEVDDLALRAEMAINDVLYWRESRKLNQALLLAVAVGSAVGLLGSALPVRRRMYQREQ